MKKHLFTIIFFAFCIALSAQAQIRFQDENGKYGLKNEAGKVVVEPKYDDLISFSDGVAFVNIGKVLDESNYTETEGKWGVIDHTGKEITPIKYDAIEAFSEGLAPVNIGGRRGSFEEYFEVEGGKWGFVNKLGNEVIPAEYDSVEQVVYEENFRVIASKKYYGFKNGKAQVTQNGRTFFIDKQGNEIDYSSIEDEWQEEIKKSILEQKIDISSLYPYSQADKVEIITFYSKSNDYKTLLKGGKVNLLPDEIDDRKFLNQEQVYKLAQLFNNIDNCFDMSMNCYDPKHLVVFYDKKGKAFTFIEVCLECISSRAIDKKLKKYGICDKNIEIFYDLLYVLKLKSNPKYYNYLSEKSEGLYKVEHREKVGFLDSSKNIVIPFIYDSEESDGEIGKQIQYVEDFDTGITSVEVAFRNPKATGFQWGVCPVIKNGKYGLINAKNEIVVPFIYDGIDGINGEYNDSGDYAVTEFIAKKGDKYGIVDLSGNIIKDFIYRLIVLTEYNGYYIQE